MHRAAYRVRPLSWGYLAARSDVEPAGGELLAHIRRLAELGRDVAEVPVGEAGEFLAADLAEYDRSPTRTSPSS